MMLSVSFLYEVTVKDPPPHDMGSQNTLDILLKWRSSLSGLLLIVEVNGVHESQKADLSRWVMGQEYIPLEFFFWKYPTVLLFKL